VRLVNKGQHALLKTLKRVLGDGFLILLCLEVATRDQRDEGILYETPASGLAVLVLKRRGMIQHLIT
jgi:hypothetical protein